LRVWAEQLPRAYRVLESDLRAAKVWGELTVRLPKLPVRDSLIAAMTLSRSLTVVTRDLVPFAAAGCKVATPWK
jgi:predicted nucleic acid-binding protein